MRHLPLTVLAVFLLTGCAAGQVLEQPSPVPSASSSTPEADTTVSVLIISGSGLTTENTAGDTIGSVDFSDGAAALQQFISELTTLNPEVSDTSQICVSPQTVYSWDNFALSLYVPAVPDPPLNGVFVDAQSPSIHGIAIRTSAGFAIGDDVSAIPATLPAAQTVDLHANIVIGGSPDPTSFVYDSVGEIEVNGATRAYGGAVVAEAGVAQQIFSPRTTLSSLC